MALVESTVYRHLDTVALVIGPPDARATRCVNAFESVRIRVAREPDVASACERLPVLMPQLVVVLTAPDPKEREDLVERTVAVGALLVEIDRELDDEALDALLDRAAQAAVDRGLVRDSPETRRED